MPDMIGATGGDTAALARRMAARARALALAHGENRQRRRRADGGRWRQPHLLWPLFSKDP